MLSGSPCVGAEAHPALIFRAAQPPGTEGALSLLLPLTVTLLSESVSCFTMSVN